jgi:hypothetical protein
MKISDEEKREVKAFIENHATHTTDLYSKIYDVLGLDLTLGGKSLKTPQNAYEHEVLEAAKSYGHPNTLKDLNKQEDK